MVKIHKEGRGFLLKLFIFLSIVNVVFFNLYNTSLYSTLILFVSSLTFLFFLQFFRNPKIIKKIDKNLIISPANGEVVHIGEVFEEEYYKEKRLLISIFMSPLDVHINRNPISGIVKYYKYHKGKYLVAWHPKSSTKNERTTTVIANNKISILVRQIAGLVARRIINYSTIGKKVNQSNQLGFIKFGSRADIFLPLGFKPNVQLKQKTKAGVTVLGKLN